MGWIDVHTHLNMLKDKTPDQALAQCQANGVSQVITIGTESTDHDIVRGLAQKYFPVVACTLGIHPHEGATYTDQTEQYLLRHGREREVVAIGEIGLDYHYDHSPRDEQRLAFRRQLGVAEQLSLPVEIHTRDAEADTIEILKEFRGRVSGIIHCFTGTQWLAEQALDLGLDISFSGVVTFKNAGDLRSVVKFVPMDRMHVETDAPFLAPLPHRGEPNVPAYVIHTAQVVAQLKGVELLELQAATVSNARRVFSKLQ